MFICIGIGICVHNLVFHVNYKKKNLVFHVYRAYDSHPADVCMY